MTKVHKPGDLVLVKGDEGNQLFQIGLGPENQDSPDGTYKVPRHWVTPLCDNPECHEWPTIWRIGKNGKPDGGFLFHYHDCELEDYKPK